MSEGLVPDYFPEQWANHEPSALPPGVEVPDYIDYIFAFRQWRMTDEGLLQSLNGSTWPIGETMVAQCNVFTDASIRAWINGKPEQAPPPGKNEYATVKSLKAIYDRNQLKDVLDRQLYTANDLMNTMQKRPILMSADMVEKAANAKFEIRKSGYEKAQAHMEEIPQADCKCGIYATRTLALLQKNAPFDSEARAYTADFVGIVKLWGVGYEGSMGWRFQFGYPDRLFTTIPSNIPHGERYGVPVELVDRYFDLFDRYGG